MITINNLTHSFGKQVIFDDIDFNINKKERIGLIGRNGSGKTTLFNILSQQLIPEQGMITIPRNYKIGYVQQEAVFSRNKVIEEACLALQPEKSDARWEAEKILFGLGFTREQMDQEPLVLSGGYQVRLNLAKVLIAQPDLLLLDEPTNYLDILATRWLSGFLKNWKKECILITHDRSFMDNVITHAMIIHRKKIRKMAGDTGKLYDQIARDEEIYEKTRMNDEKKRKEIEVYISRFRAKARLANQVQSRIKKLAKQEKKEKLEKISDLEFSFTSAPFPAKQILEARDLGFSYDSGKKQDLIKNLSFTVEKNDRICVIGRNGKGKTTLLKLLYQNLQPQQGYILVHPEARIGYFGQINIDHLTPYNTIEEELFQSSDVSERRLIRNVCGTMMFEGDDALKKISILSGGEKSRVLLGKIILSGTNLLLLDEPTNHLDMESCDALMMALDQFPGAVIMVTHNELFLNGLPDKLVIFDDEQCFFFNGTYQDFLAQKGWQDEKSSFKEKDKKENIRSMRQARAELINQRSRILNPLEKDISHTEDLIHKKETQLHKNNQDIIRASAEKNSRRINELSVQNNILQKEIDDLYHGLEKLASEQEKQIKIFAEKLEEISG